MKKVIFALPLLYSINAFSQQTNETAKEEIQKVFHTYMNSVINKDSATFCSLFALDSVSFYGIADTATANVAVKQNPRFKIILKDSYRNFMHWDVSTKMKLEEKFNDVQIWNDNAIATLSFHYSFWVDGKESNWGIETWQLMFDGKAWKIMSALFSFDDERIKPDTASK
jgi:hypothetical protein